VTKPWGNFLTNSHNMGNTNMGNRYSTIKTVLQEIWGPKSLNTIVISDASLVMDGNDDKALSFGARCSPLASTVNRYLFTS